MWLTVQLNTIPIMLFRIDTLRNLAGPSLVLERPSIPSEVRSEGLCGNMKGELRMILFSFYCWYHRCASSVVSCDELSFCVPSFCVSTAEAAP